MDNVHAFAYQYIERGFSPIPVEFKSKICKLKEWQKLKLATEKVQALFEPPCNVGVVLGDLSGGLVDIDLDCPAAIDLAPYILPETKMVFGRASKPRSHWIYKATDPGSKISFAHPDGGMLVELRANGQMTVFPGSVHESGEEVVFEQNDDPAEIQFDQLAAYTRQLAAASLILPYWKEGQRHKLALALSGTLLFGGVIEQNARQLLDALIAAANDEEPQDRRKCLVDTAGTVKSEQPVAGRKELADIIGEKAAGRFCEWLGFTDSRDLAKSKKSGAVMETFGGPVPQSDVANAERFAARHSDKAVYCPQLKRWLVWNGSRWAVDEGGQAMRLAKAVAREIAHEAGEKGDKESLAWAAKVNDLLRLRSMLSVAQSECEASLEAFDADPWKLNCQSGIIDLQTGEQLAHDPSALMRKLAPVSLDPKAECPRFVRFLERIFAGDNELTAFLQRAIGYSLTGKTDEQCLFVLIGAGANGKSTLIRLIQDLLGDYAQQTPMETLMVTRSGSVSNDIARLEGHRFVSAVEAEAGQRLAEAKIKQLTGGDRLTARPLYSDFFEFMPQFKLWVGTNQLPVVRGMNEGIWRRFRVIPFNVTIPEAERDPNLPDKLKAELPGILNWAITGCLEWQRRGLRPPESITKATKSYRADMDLVAQFVADCCVIESKAEETVKALYAGYNAWCEENGEQPLSKRAFGQRLQELGFGEGRSGMVRKRRGIRRKTDEESLEDLGADFASDESDDADDGSAKYQVAY